MNKFNFNRLLPRFVGNFDIRQLLPGLYGNPLDMSGLTGLVLPSAITAAGSSVLDLSGSTGAFKFPTGAQSGQRVVTVSSALVGATVVLTAAQSGGIFINRSTSGSPSWTLPTLADGLMYTFICGNTTAGFTVTGAQTIQFKTNASGTALTTTTTLTNTQATAVVGDAITIVGDGVGNTWKMVSQTGVFAAS